MRDTASIIESKSLESDNGEPVEGERVLAQPTGEEEISLLDLLIVLLRRRRLIFATTFGLALFALIVALILPFRYTAVTSILPPQQNNSTGAAILSQLGSLGSVASAAGGALGLKNPNDLQVAMLKSRTVEDAMVNRFHLMSLYHAKRMSDARKKLENAVDIDNGAKTGLISISVTDRDPRRAEEMANGYVEEFRKFSATLAVTEASQRRLFFEQQLGHAKDQLANAEEDLKKTEQQTGLIQIDSQARAVIESVAQLRAQIVAKEVEIEGLRSFATGENPELQTAEQELAALKSQQAKMGAGDGSNALLIPKGNMQAVSLEYVRKVRDVKYYGTIFDLMARQYEIAKVDEAREGTIIQVVDRAVIPDGKSSPKRILIVVGATALGLFWGIGWALTSEWHARLSKDPIEGARIATLKQMIGMRKKQ